MSSNTPSIQIRRIRETKTKVAISAEVEGDEFNVKAGAEPAKAFLNALEGLVPTVRDILDIPEEWEGLRVTGLTLTPFGSKGNMKVTIVARRDMQVGSPFNITVPIRYLDEIESEEGEEADPSQLSLTESQRKAVNRLTNEAIKYIRGLKSARMIFGQLELGLSGGGIQEGETVDTPPAGGSPVAKFPAPTEGAKKRAGRRKKIQPPPAETPEVGAQSTEPDSEEPIAASGR
jgi:hypothetical protein